MKTRKFSIRVKLLVMISLVGVLCCVLLGGVTYSLVSQMMVQQIKSDAISLAEVAANEVNGAEFEAITQNGDGHYETILKQLSKYKKSDMIEYIYSMRLNDSGNVEFVVDADTDDPAEFGDPYDLLPDMEDAFNGESTCDQDITTDEWGSYFSAYAPIKKDSTVVGIVGCDVSVDSVNEQLASLRNTIIGITFGCVLISILCAFFISFGLGRNLRRLYSKVAELNSGDGDLTQQVVITSGDELETIAGEFNRFIEQVRKLVAGVADSAESVKNSSAEVDSLAGSSHKQLNQMSGELEMLSARMEETSAGTSMIIQNLNKVAEEASALYQEAAASSDEAKGVSESAQERKEEVEAVEQKTKEIISQWREQMQETAKRCEGIDEIDHITGEILKVASTTNILALNAHTEAARAGTFGRGFSIIADNISVLSDQISALVKNIQGTNHSVKLMVEDLLKGMDDISGFLDENVAKDYAGFVTLGSDYSQRMAGMAELLRRFNGMAEEMSGHISQMRDNISEIDTVIQGATEEITQVHCFSVDVRQDTEKMEQVATGNRTESEKMTEQVSKYRF